MVFKNWNGCALMLQMVRVCVGPYQQLRTRPNQMKSGANPYWNQDLMFVAAEPFDDMMHIIVEDRMNGKVIPRIYPLLSLYSLELSKSSLR
jgi:hypothetical protein